MKSNTVFLGAALSLGLAVAVAGMLASSPANAAGKVCYKGGQAYSKIASGARKSKAKERARRKWNDYAMRLMGTSRANWNNAKYRGYHCNRKGIWYCRAIATPCI